MIRKNISIVIVLFAVALMITLASCDPAKKYEKQEQEDIQNYLSENSDLNFVKQASGLYYLERVAGTGISPVMNDSVYVIYTLALLNGTVLGTNLPYGCIVGENVDGFDEGIQLMKVGGTSTLLIPSKIGYGSDGNYPIPGYTSLLFDIELLKVVKLKGN
jgi:FKBP-type peptidyl-prolyl cis-trans isomerase FkpA